MLFNKLVHPLNFKHYSTFRYFLSLETSKVQISDVQRRNPEVRAKTSQYREETIHTVTVRNG